VHQTKTHENRTGQHPTPPVHAETFLHTKHRKSVPEEIFGEQVVISHIPLARANSKSPEERLA